MKRRSNRKKIIYLTAPYDKDGYEAVEYISTHKVARFEDVIALVYIQNGLRCTAYGLKRGVDWHLSKRAAVRVARANRLKWIDERRRDLDEVLNLPEIA